MFYRKKIFFSNYGCRFIWTLIKILNSIEKNLSRKGLIVFDEGNSKIWSGEKKAMDNFLKKYEKKYKKEFIPYARQPDVILKKI